MSNLQNLFAFYLGRSSFFTVFRGKFRRRHSKMVMKAFRKI
jgi:hypothetical protein